MAAYPLNSNVRVSSTFTVADVLTDPTTIILTVKDPTGTITVYSFAGGTVTKSSTGVFYKDLSCGIAGTWYYAFQGTGAVVAQSEHDFFIRPSGVA